MFEASQEITRQTSYVKVFINFLYHSGQNSLNCDANGFVKSGVMRFLSAVVMAVLSVLPGATGACAGPVEETPAMIEITGEVVGRGAVCVQFQVDGGDTVSLENAPKQIFETGARFLLKGDWVRVSRCMQGKAFAVTEYIRQ